MIVTVERFPHIHIEMSVDMQEFYIHVDGFVCPVYRRGYMSIGKSGGICVMPEEFNADPNVENAAAMTPQQLWEHSNEVSVNGVKTLQPKVGRRASCRLVKDGDSYSVEF